MNDKKEEQNNRISRRHFFSLVGWSSITLTGAGAAVETVRFFFPNVLYEPPTTIKVGIPADYPKGTVIYNDEKKLYIVRDETGFFAMSAVCTHLGCTVLKDAQNFLCPCHGAVFDKNGLVTKGPAKSPLPRFRIVLTEGGVLQVDIADVVDRNYRLKV